MIELVSRLDNHVQFDSANLDKAKKLFEDWLACLMYALKKRSAHDFLKTYFEAEEFSNLSQFPSRDRSFLFAYLSHFHEFDDSEFIGETHPSSVVFSALCSLEQEGRSFNELLGAAVYGMSSLLIFGPYFNPNHYAKNWHGTGTIGSIAACLACSHYLGFSAEKKGQALRVVSSLMSGNQLVFGSPAKFLNSARASQNGVLSCQMTQSMKGIAELDQVGFETILQLFSGNVEPLNCKLESNLNFIHSKSFPLCHCLVPVVENLLNSFRERKIDRFQVSSLKLYLSPYSRKILKWQSPRNLYEVGFSPEFCLWLCLKKEEISFSSFLTCDVELAKFQKDLSIVSVEIDSNLDYMNHRIEIHQNGGAVDEIDFTFNRGFAEVENRFLESKSEYLKRCTVVDEGSYFSLQELFLEEDSSLRRLNDLISKSYAVQF